MSTRLMTILGVLTAVLIASQAWAQTEELRYEKRDTRQATRRATLAHYQPNLDWSAWHVVGPFNNVGRDKHDLVYPPEQGVDLDASYRGKGGREVTWETLDDVGWNPIELLRFGSDEANLDGICYLYREAECDRDATMHFEMGSDDGLKLWLNGRLFYTRWKAPTYEWT